MNELDSIKVYADGRTAPRVDSGIDITLVQDNVVQVGKLNLGEQYVCSVEIDHLKNQSDLDILATQIIKENKPEYLESKNSVIAICPKYIAEQMIWE